MYAIIESGGKQYRVAEGDVIDVELLENEENNTVIEFKEVLMVYHTSGVKIGAPHLPSSFVRAERVGEVKGPKVIAFKYKRRKNIRRKVGHRQRYTRVKITEIIG